MHARAEVSVSVCDARARARACMSLAHVCEVVTMRRRIHACHMRRRMRVHMVGTCM
jgi:hypothetical protein